jgi:superfamily I DNA/RNA helicase
MWGFTTRLSKRTSETSSYPRKRKGKPDLGQIKLAGQVWHDAPETERHLLYVACTRARDELLVTAVAPESEFLVDIQKR